MRVELHDFQQGKWFLELESTDTIARLKELNAESKNYEPGTSQKLFFSGKILGDTDTLESIEYTEGKSFIVCMASKPRKRATRDKSSSALPPKVSSSPEASSAITKSENHPEEGSVLSGKNPEPSGTLPKSEDEDESSPRQISADADITTGPSALLKGAKLEEAIQSICDMGYDSSLVRKAMAVAFNNPDRAVELLVTGAISTAMPDDEDDVDDAPAADADPASSIDRNLFEAADEEDQESNIDFQKLLGLDESQLSSLRAMLQTNPSAVMQIIHPIMRENPELAQYLLGNMNDFVRFLQGGSEFIAGPEEEDESIEEITEEENEAIERLTELGFDRHIVAMAYFACDKDEQLAANYLLEHGDED